MGGNWRIGPHCTHAAHVRACALSHLFLVNCMNLQRDALLDGAEEGTRTPTPLRVRGPEPRASANSATSAQYTGPAFSTEPAATSSLANAGLCVKFWRVGTGRNGRSFLLRPRRSRAVTPAWRRARFRCCWRRASKWGSRPWRRLRPCRKPPSTRPERWPWW